MNKYLLAIVLVSVSLCHAMNSGEDEYVPSGKRGRVPVNSSESSSSSQEGESTKKMRAVGQKSVQKSKFFVIDLDHTKKVRSFAEKPATIRTYMRQLVKKQGYTLAAVAEQIDTLRAEQDVAALRTKHDNLKRFCMQCPACNIVMQTDEEESALTNYFFKHWFLTQQHQAALYADVINLIAKDRQGALESFKAHGLPKSNVVQLPLSMEQEVEPMEEGEEEIDVAVDEEQEEPLRAAFWYIVDSVADQPHILTVLEGATRTQVAALYLERKIPGLSLASPEVHEQGDAFKINEEVVKQLMVQDAAARKKVVCPHGACEVMFAQQEDDVHLAALFAQMALHHVQSHPQEGDTVLAIKATHLAATSFQEAYAASLKND